MEQALIAFQAGYTIGRWVVPEQGFAWRADVSPLGTNEEGLYLVANPGRLRRYALLRRDAPILSEFARLALGPTREAILAFAGRWGPLGIGIPVIATGAEMPTTDDIHIGEEEGTWMNALADFRMLYGIWQDVSVMENEDAHGPTVIGSARRRLQLLRRRDSIVLELDPSHHGVMGRRYVVWPGERDAELRQRLHGLDDVEVARYFLIAEVNKQLQDVSVAVLPFAGSRMRIVPKTLLASLYLRLAQALTPTTESGLPERPCDFCGLPFFPPRSNKRYCSDPCKEAASYRRRTRRRAPG